MSGDRKPVSIVAWVLMGLSVLILYPLSIGPYAWLAKNVLPVWVYEWTGWVYDPIWWYAWRDHRFGNFLRWYLQIWGVTGTFLDA